MEIKNTGATEFQEEFYGRIKPISFWGGVGLGLLFLLIQVVTMFPIMMGAMAVYGAENTSASIEVIMGLGLPLAFIAGAWILSRGRGLSDTAYEWRSSFIPITIVGLILTFSVSYIIGSMLTYLPNYEEMMDGYEAMFENIDPMDLVLTVAVIGPICEEIIFRGVILEGLLKKYDTTKAILFSSLIFSVIHLQPLQVVATFFIGLILGWIYVKTQSLWVCIAIHIINNFVAVLTMDNGVETTASYFDSPLLFAGSLVLAIFMAYLAYLVMRRLFHKERA